MKYTLLIFFWLSISCHSQKNAIDIVSKHNTSHLKQDSMVLLFEHNYGGGAKKELQILHKESELKDVYTRINSTRKPGIPIPKVDFSEYMVIFYSFGEITGNTIPTLRIANETGEILNLKVVKKADVLKETNIIAPFCLYKIPITTKKIIVQELD